MSESKDIKLKPKTNPILDSLSDYLKDPKNYQEIQAKILKTFKSDCGHTEVMQWAQCKRCTKKMLARRKILKELGFKNPAQYMMWRKTHEKIIKMMPLMDWKSNTPIK